MNGIQIDTTIHLLELLVIGGAAWKVVRMLNRIYEAMRNFPPHKHVGKQIIYPKDFQPTRPEVLANDTKGEAT